jgi:transcription initiation factor IIE alpha subunit
MSSQKGKNKGAPAKARGVGKSFVNKVVLRILEALDDGSEVPGLLCENCHEKPAKDAYGVIVYENPRTNESTIRYVCGPDCLEEYFYSTEFHYFHCSNCKRYIRSYNPLYPMEEHYVEEDGQKICLRCHEADKL